ncbi:hypothetical protein DM465_21015 [Escherichia coli]|nr:hypothetical protein DM465_21015 [Escherichia coli]
MILNCSALRYAGGYLSSLMTALMITFKKRYLHRMVNSRAGKAQMSMAMVFSAVAIFHSLLLLVVPN